ncbi:3-hydroxyacyl-CoA dehydrogenase NAD-binding domain-containing protein [Nocardia sp. NPDC049149]|uniref:3-hydroxyacyl-CoA dehydrogenase NAD-binding domain-containing protein n=1 Tax=Nocardia sp. NPDC049149 TaxID=3364315 RepID=UPI003714B281
MSKVAIVGAGVIGVSWGRLARRHGWSVVFSDPRPDLAELVAKNFPGDAAVTVAADLATAVAGADLVQENGPERLEIKQQLFATIVAATGPDTVLATSSSSIAATLIAAELDDAAAAKIVVGHPFNPPELMPLVEVVPGERTSAATTDRAVAIYRSWDRTPVVLGKELPGFVANRLQSVLGREARWLVEQGVVDVAQLDTILQNSLGLRWSTIGLFEGNVLGGGPGGARHLFAGVGAVTGKIQFHDPDPAQVPALIEQIEATYGTGQDVYDELSAKRDTRTTAVLAALAATEARTGN